MPTSSHSCLHASASCSCSHTPAYSFLAYTYSCLHHLSLHPHTPVYILKHIPSGQLVTPAKTATTGSVAHSPLLVPPSGMDTLWKSASCLKIMKVRFACCLRLSCIVVVWLMAPLRRF